MRAYATANTAHSISNDNHSDLKRTISIMISKSYRKFTAFPTGDYSVFSMEEFLGNKDLSDEIIGQSPVGNIVNCVYKICRHRFYTGCKGCRIIGVCGFRHKRRTRPFSVCEECAKLLNLQSQHTEQKKNSYNFYNLRSHTAIRIFLIICTFLCKHNIEY